MSNVADIFRLHAAIVNALQKLSFDGDYKADIIRQNVMDVMNQGGDNRSAIESRIRDINRVTAELVAGIAGNRVAGVVREVDYESQFKALSDELTTLQSTLQTIAATKAARPLVNHQLGAMMEVLDSTSLTVTEYDDSLTRKLIDTIKVMDNNRLLFVFKDGRTVEQTI